MCRRHHHHHHHYHLWFNVRFSTLNFRKDVGTGFPCWIWAGERVPSQHLLWEYCSKILRRKSFLMLTRNHFHLYDKHLFVWNWITAWLSRFNRHSEAAFWKKLSVNTRHDMPLDSEPPSAPLPQSTVSSHSVVTSRFTRIVHFERKFETLLSGLAHTICQIVIIIRSLRKYSTSLLT